MGLQSSKHKQKKGLNKSSSTMLVNPSKNNNQRSSQSARAEGGGSRLNTEIIEDRYQQQQQMQVRELLTERGKENISAMVYPTNKQIDFSQAMSQYMETQRFMKPDFSIKVVQPDKEWQGLPLHLQSSKQPSLQSNFQSSSDQQNNASN